MQMRHASVAGFLIIMTVYTAILIGWFIFDSGAILDVLLFYVLGIPLAAALVWWGGQTRQRRR